MLKGSTHTPESRAKISTGLTGKKLSKKHKQAISRGRIRYFALREQQAEKS